MHCLQTAVDAVVQRILCTYYYIVYHLHFTRYIMILCNESIGILYISYRFVIKFLNELVCIIGINHRRKPKCDEIFRRDPANPDLNICKLCAKRVRSKWHHFQTHYSRNHRCSECHAVYSRIDTLRSHAKKRHCTVIPRYYFGIPANVWHRVIVQCPGSEPRPVLGYNPIIRQQI